MQVANQISARNIPQSEAFRSIEAALKRNIRVNIILNQGDVSGLNRGETIVLDFNPKYNDRNHTLEICFLDFNGSKVERVSCRASIDGAVPSSPSASRKIECLIENAKNLRAQRVYPDVQVSKKRSRDSYEPDAIRQLMESPDVQKVAVRKVILDMKPAMVDKIVRESSSQYKTFLRGLSKFMLNDPESIDSILEMLDQAMQRNPELIGKVQDLCSKYTQQRFDLNHSNHFWQNK